MFIEETLWVVGKTLTDKQFLMLLKRTTRFLRLFFFFSCWQFLHRASAKYHTRAMCSMDPKASDKAV
jgi:hypothetical protein